MVRVRVRVRVRPRVRVRVRARVRVTIRVTVRVSMKFGGRCICFVSKVLTLGGHASPSVTLRAIPSVTSG